jgi:hypothetical protein
MSKRNSDILYNYVIIYIYIYNVKYSRTFLSLTGGETLTSAPADPSIPDQVAQLAYVNPVVVADSGVDRALYFISVLVWGARLLCQLRRRPALPDLQVPCLPQAHHSLGGCEKGRPSSLDQMPILGKSNHWSFDWLAGAAGGDGVTLRGQPPAARPADRTDRPSHTMDRQSPAHSTRG